MLDTSRKLGIQICQMTYLALCFPQKLRFLDGQLPSAYPAKKMHNFIGGHRVE